MAGPWEKYAPSGGKPWERYAPPAAAAAGAELTPAPPDLGLGAQSPPPEPAPQDTGFWSDPAGNAGRSLTIGSQAVGRGLAGLLGGPVDLASAGINGLLGIGEFAGLLDEPTYVSEPFGGSATIARGAGRVFEGLGGELYDDDDLAWNERILSKGIEYGTTAGTAAGGLTAAAGRAPAAIEPFIRPYTANAARTAAGDTAAGAGSGLAVGTYEETVPEDQRGPIGMIASALFGGLGGASLASLGEGLGRAAANVARGPLGMNVERSLPENTLTGQPFTRAEADQAAERVQRAASNPVAARRQIEDSTASMDQFASRAEQPTVGARSEDVGLVLLENAERTRNPQNFIQRDRQVNDRARDLLDSSAPPGSTGRQLTDYADAEINRRVSAASDDLAVARERAGTQAGVQQAEGDLAQYRGQGDPASRRIDEAFRSTLDQETRRKNALYNDPGLTGAEVDARRLIETADDMRASLSQVGDPNSIPVEILNRIENLAIRDDNGALTGVRPMTYGDVQDLRAQVSEALADATAASGRGASGSGPRVANLRALRGELDGYIDDLATGEGGAAEAARAAIDNYRGNFAPRFREGRAGEFAAATKSDRFGTRTRPGDTAGRFLDSNKAEDVDSLARALDFNGNPERVADARAYLMDRLAGAGVNDKNGALRPDRLREWKAKNENVVTRVPGMADEVDRLIALADNGQQISTRLGEEARRAEATLRQTERETRSGALGAIGGKDPYHAVKSVFDSTDPERTMQGVIEIAGKSPEARNGLKAAVREYLTDTSTTTALQKTLDGRRPVSFAKLENFFDRNAKALAEVYSPDEMNALRQSHELLRPLGNLALRGTSGSDTAEKGKNVMRALEAGLKARYGVLKGGGIMRTLRIAIESLPNDKQNVDQLVNQMMFDPDLAKHLLSRDVADRINTPAWNAKLNRLIAYGAGVREGGEQEQ